MFCGLTSRKNFRAWKFKMQSVVKAASVGQLAKASCLGVPANTALPAAAVAGPAKTYKRGIVHRFLHTFYP